MTRLVIVCALTSLVLASSASAEEQTITLEVDGMWCAGCSYIVEQTLAQMPGVREVAVSGREKTAVVTFDDETTTVVALIEATAGVGFPSVVAE